MKLFARVLAAVAAVFVVSSPVFASGEIGHITTTPVRASGKASAPAVGAKSIAGNVADAAAGWLMGQQNGAGAFPWTAGQTAVHGNTQGAIALGLLRAYERNGDPAVLAAALENGECIIVRCSGGTIYADGFHRFATHDALFLEELSRVSGQPMFADFVQVQLWNRLTAGTYGEPDVDAAGYAAFVVSSRGSIGELAAWDLSKLAIAAHVAGETATRDALMGGILQSLELTVADTHTVYDRIGLAGAVWASAKTGVALDPMTGRWASAASTADLAMQLATFQAPNGGFIAGTDQDVIDSEADAQSTAFAMQALAATDPVAFSSTINAGFDFLIGLQQASGQFLSHAGAAATTAGGVEAHGEALEAYSVVRLGTDRYVAVDGSDAGDCSQPALPCLTIQYAVDQANEGNTVHIGSGTYSDPARIATDRLHLIGEGLDAPVLDRTAGTVNQQLLVVEAAGVEIENLQFNADRAFIAEALACVGGCTDLQVRDSVFEQRNSNPTTRSTYGRTNAIAAGVAIPGFPARTGPVQVTIQGVIVRPAAGEPDSLFRAGLALEGGFAQVGGSNPGEGNDIASRNHDVIANNANGGNTVIEGNTFRGFGVQVGAPTAASGAIDIRDNRFELAAVLSATAVAADHSAMRLISNAPGIAVNVADNVFLGHERGVLVENFTAVTLSGNQFTPREDSSTFRHVVLSNKELFTNSTPPAPLPQSLALSATGNVFNAGTVGGTGTAVWLLNDNAQGEPAGGYYGSIVFGGPGAGEPNAFVGDFGRYFSLGNFGCAASNSAPCPLAAEYTAAIGARNTPVVPFTGDVQATDNTFDGVAPADMGSAQQNALLARTVDSASNPLLGTVQYGFTAVQADTFVDDTFAGASYGQALVFSHPHVDANGRTVYFGVDAFASLADGIAAVETDGRVFVAAGAYAGNIVLARKLDVIGAGGDASGTVVSGSIAVAASGAGAFDPILVGGLRVSAATGSGMQLTGAHSFLRFEGVEFVGNPAHGVDFVGSGNNGIDFAGPGCAFTDNGQLAVRTSTTARAAQVSFTDCDFSGNQAGIVVFGGNSGGDGQIRDWSVVGSRFRGNDSTDSHAFGGGIWIKTGGPTSLIDGFTVSGSTFSDNGSANVLNQVGITVRARPGSTLANVELCDNIYSETAAPGTQTYGVLVYDDTGNNGYTPVRVCDSSFDGLLAAVSGNEQAGKAAKTQPVVLLSGNTVTGGGVEREYVNDPVRNLQSGEAFPTIAAAMADAETLTAHTIELAIGVYTENVVFSHPGMTLQGAGSSSVIAGTQLPGVGVRIPSGFHGTALRGLVVRDFALLGGGDACVHATQSNDLVFEDLAISNCQNGRGGIFIAAGAGVDNVTIRGNEVSDVGPLGARGIVIWDGPKTNIRITDNHVHDIAGCCGIELQDGTASDVTITGNLVERTGDNGIGVVGLGGGSGVNLIADNTITDTGRYGIELKLANGTGRESGAGAVLVDGNTVTNPNFAAQHPAEQRDLAGIAVFRRAFLASSGNVDIPHGVVVRNNTVSGFRQSHVDSVSEGFGIVLEGTAMYATGNHVFDNDIGIQRQQGHLPYAALGSIDGDQSDLVDNYFGRGNSPLTCAWLQGNDFDDGTANGIDIRDVGGAVEARILNVDTGEAFCSIQAAIDDAETDAGDVIDVGAGSYAENVLVHKGVVLRGPFHGTSAVDRTGANEAVLSPPTGHAFNVRTTGATIAGFTIQDVNDTAIVSGENYGGLSSDVTIRHNRILDVHSGSGIYTNGSADQPVQDWTVDGNLVRNVEAANGSGINLWSVDGATISENVIEDVGFGGIQTVHGQNVAISGNRIEGSVGNGINVASSGAVSVSHNTLVAANSGGTTTEAALTLYGQSSNVDFFCNRVEGAGVNGFSTSPGFAAPLSGIRVFHNAFAVVPGTGVSHNIPGVLEIGPNWYGGSAAADASTGTNAGGAQLADALAADPVGSPGCGNTTPAQLLVHAGSPQSATIGTAFGSQLSARVTDGLGGAVTGVAVDFAAPAGSVPSSTLSPTTVVTDYNGIARSSATANVLAGTYAVSATHVLVPATGDTPAAVIDADFALTNTKGTGTVVWGPLGLVYNDAPQNTTASIAEDASGVCTVSATAAADVGSYTVTASCSGDNYVASDSETLAITPKTVDIELDNLGPHLFDGTAHAATATVIGLEGDDTLDPTITYDGVEAAQSAVGSYLTMALFDPAEYPNYVALPAFGTLVIGKAPALVTIDASDLQQDFGATRPVDASADPVTTGNVLVTYDGSETAPSAVGTYSVLAVLDDPGYEGVASATLVISDSATITLDLSPVTAEALVGASTYTDFIDFAGMLENSGEVTAQPVHFVIDVVRIDDGNGSGGLPVAIGADDVKACVYDPSGHAAQAPNHDGCGTDFQWLFTELGTSGGRPAVRFRYPNLPANDLPLPTGEYPMPPGNLRLRAGEYRVTVDVVGSQDGTVYASATTNTTSVPDAAISYNGATFGPAEELLLSTVTLANGGGRATGNVIVRVTLSDMSGAPLSAADAELFYQLGGSYQPLPLSVVGNDLQTWYGPAGGFPMEDGHDATDAGAGLFHRTGDYRIVYDVIDVATGTLLYATGTVEFTIAANAVNFALSDLQQVYDGTPRPVSVAAAPANASYEVLYQAKVADECPATAGGSPTAPIAAGSWCVWVNATGTFSGSASGTLAIVPADAAVTLDPASLDVVFDGGAHAAIAATTPDGLALDVRYDGATEAPVAIGSYTVTATVTDPNYQGGTSGVLTIAPSGSALTVTGDTVNAVTVDGTAHYAHSSGTTTLDGPAPAEFVRAFLTVSHAGGLLPEDLAIEYRADVQESASCVADGPVYWCPLPLASNGDGTLGVAFGPLTGFPLSDGAVSHFRTVHHRGGAFHTSVSLVGVESGEVHALGSATVNVAELELAASAPATAQTATAVDSSVTLRNRGSAAILGAAAAPNDENVIGLFRISLDDGELPEGAMSISYLAADSNYHEIPLVACDGDLCGAFGPSVGFPVSVDYLSTSLFRSVFSVAGSYSLSTQIVGVDSNAVFAETTQSLTVTAGSADVLIDAASLGATYDGTAHAVTATTLPEDLAYTVTYDGSSTAPTNAGTYTVEVTVDDGNHQGSATAQLVVAPKAVTIGLDGLGPFTYDGNAHEVVTSVAGLVGGDTLPLQVNYGGSATAPVNAGSYLVLVTFDPVSNPNYVALPAFGTLVIEKADAGVTLADAGPFAYNGQPWAVTPVNPHGVALSIAYAGTDGTSYGPSAAAPVDAGSYSATVTVADANHAQDPVAAQLTIVPAPVTLSFGNLSHTYDGTPKFASVGTTPAGVAVDIAYTQGATAVASPTDAGDYLASATIGNPNYLLDGGAEATLVIGKATAQVTLSALTQLHDGSARPVQVATQPAGLVVAITYDGAAAAPSAVGSYAVEALVDEANYQGQASATLTILAMSVSDIEAVGPASFSGVAGVALAGALPTVKVSDSAGNGVPGISVVFAATDGSIGGNTSETVATDENGEAAVTGWTLSRSAGSNAMTALVDGLPGLQAVAFTASGAEEADVSVLKTSEQSILTPGMVIDYTIAVGNAGPSDAQQVDITDVLPAGLDAASAAWICIAEGAAVCSSESGTGDVLVSASVPVQGVVTIVLSATVSEGVEGRLDNLAEAILVSGIDAGDANNASVRSVDIVDAGADLLEVFSDGFEGQPLAAATAKSGVVLASAPVELVPDGDALRLSPQPVLELLDSSGATAVVVDAIGVDGRVWLRLRESVAGAELGRAWTRLDKANALVDWHRDADGLRVLQVVGQSMLLETRSVSPLDLRVARPLSGARAD